MTSLTNFPRMSQSLGRQIADAHDEISRFQTKVTLRGSVHYGTHQTADDKTVIAYLDGYEFRYRVHHKSKKKGDHESGYAITRDGKELDGYEFRGLPKSKREAARVIALDARLAVNSKYLAVGRETTSN